MHISERDLKIAEDFVREPFFDSRTNHDAPRAKDVLFYALEILARRLDLERLREQWKHKLASAVHDLGVLEQMNRKEEP